MSEAHQSPAQGARARPARTQTSDADRTSPEEQPTGFVCANAVNPLWLKLDEILENLAGPGEPTGTVCADAKQPSLRKLQLGVLADSFNGLQTPPLTSNKKKHVLVYSRTFDPILQSGPTCGMVALAMLARMIGKEEVTTEKIVAHARKRGFSKRGELFSVWSARALVRDLLNMEATVEEATLYPWMMCKDLIDHAIMFCFDDDEGQPCCHRGRAAHWALITGFALVYNEDLTPKQQEVFNSYKTGGKGDVSERLALHQALDALEIHSQDPPTVYVLGRQGNSEDIFHHRWSLMVKSCQQLLEYPPYGTKYVFPPEGMAATMRGKYLKVPVPHELAAFQVGSHSEYPKNLDVLSKS